MLFFVEITELQDHVDLLASKESMALRAQIVFDSLDSFLAGKQVNVIL